MNISSLIVMAAVEAAESVINEIKSISGCDVPMSENSMLIVSIEGENIESESGKMKQIENIDGVISANLFTPTLKMSWTLKNKKSNWQEIFLNG